MTEFTIIEIMIDLFELHVTTLPHLHNKSDESKDGPRFYHYQINCSHIIPKMHLNAFAASKTNDK